MGYIITGESAGECMFMCRKKKESVDWRSAQRVPNPTRVLEQSTKPSAKTLKTALELPLLKDLSMPVNLMVNTADKRLKSKQALGVLRKTDLPYGSLIQLGKGVYCLSPELYFVWFASKNTLAKTVLLGHELCGRYVLPTNTDDDYLKCEPRTDIGRIRKLIEQLHDEPGQERARKALEFVHENSWSPMESVMSTLFSLPVRKYGGFGLNLFDMNVPISTNSVDRDLSPSHARRFCDMYSKEAQVDLEYDGEQWHQGADNQARDAKRRNELEREGISVITVSRDEIHDVIAMTKIADGIKKRMGRKCCTPTVGNLKERNALFRQIVPGHVFEGNPNVGRKEVSRVRCETERTE